MEGFSDQSDSDREELDYLEGQIVRSESPELLNDDLNFVFLDQD